MWIPWLHDYNSLGAIFLSAFNEPANTRESPASKTKLSSISLKISFILIFIKIPAIFINEIWWLMIKNTDLCYTDAHHKLILSGIHAKNPLLN